MGSMVCPQCQNGYCYLCEIGDNYGTGLVWQCDNCNYELVEYWEWDKLI